MFFDPRAAKLLQPGQHIVIEGCQGLRLVATASRKTWTYRYKDDSGKMKQVAIGQWPAIPVQAAAAQWQELRTQRSAGVDPRAQRKRIKVAAKQVTPEAYTVRQLVQDYVDGPLKDGRKPTGHEAARRALHAVLDENPTFAESAAHEVTRGVAFGILDAKKATPMAAVKLRSMFGAAWEHAHDSGRLDGAVPNWWRQVMRGKLKSKGKIIGGEHVGQGRRVLTGDEVGALLRWLDNMHPHGRDAVVMYLWTCTRGAEIFSLRPEHVTKERGLWWWTVPKSLTKNAGEALAVDLRVPLYGRALEVVQRRIKAAGPDGWLFTGAKGGPYTQHDFSTYIYGLQPYSEKVARRSSPGLVLPVTNWTPHNLRRTARTMLAQLGCINEVAEAIVGHMPKDIVATYNAHTYDAERREWLAKLDQYLEGLAARHPET
ncbi:tyrosine-type recombinase/integrase [Acidovorax sp. BL-A-41-H1]|uniref:tyrosine-type recombinase/integrase n=1 Tax=Acidovorax sp. BL-A-41-H1 TaxID=3421102 RepID=UPI003F78DFB8